MGKEKELEIKKFDPQKTIEDAKDVRKILLKEDPDFFERARNYERPSEAEMGYFRY